MKTAYEIAMERLEKESGPARKLTDDQRARLAEIEKTYAAQIAELKLSYESRFVSVETFEELDQLKAELAGKIAELEAARDQEKDAIWNEE